MRLALRRFALDGIGPAGARFDPLAVDLTDGDVAVRNAVLFLENGGGKSVLLRLLFSVVLPGRRATLGGTSLDGYVLTGDTGHVVLEWDRPEGGRIVTGTVLEWRNRTRSGTSANLQQVWYSFEPRPGVLTLDSLPMREDERRVTRTGFRERLAELARAHPELQLVVEDAPGAWSQHLLRSTPLDPEAFRYQRQMNADEAEADNLFAGIKTDDDFVRFVVTAIHEPDELVDFGDLLAAYAVQLGRRAELEAEAVFCGAAAGALRPMAATWAAQRSAAAGSAEAERAGRSLRGSLDRAAGEAEGRSAAASAQADQAGSAAADAERRAAAVGDLVSELRRLEAEYRLADAVALEGEARDALVGARTEAAAWGTVPLLVDLAGVEAEVDSLREAQEAAASELAPLRRDAEAAEARFAGRLLEEADELRGMAAAAAESAAVASARVRELAAEADVARTRGGAAGARAAGLRERVEEARQAEQQVRDDGLLGGGEPPALGLRRSESELAGAREALVGLRARLGALDARAGELRADARALVPTVSSAEADARSLRRELDELRAEADRLLIAERVTQLVPGANDLWVVVELLVELLASAVDAAAIAARATKVELGERQSALDALGADGLLPPSPDVRLVWDALVAARIPSASGWSWLDRNLDEEGRRRVLEANPAVAGGVVVTDPERVNEARRALAEAGVETDGVVVLGAAGDLEQPAAGIGAPVRRALYDRAWADRERVRLEIELEAARERLDAHDAVLVRDSPLLGEVRDLLRRCPPARRVVLGDQLSVAEARLGEAKGEQERVEGELAATEQERVAVGGREPDLRSTEARLERGRERLGDLVVVLERSVGFEAEADQLERSVTALADRASSLSEEAEHVRATSERDRRRVEDSRSEAERRQIEAGRLSSVPERPGPDEASEALASQARTARDVYDAEREGRDLTPQLASAERRAAQLRVERAGVDVAVLARAEDLARLPGAREHDERRRHSGSAAEAAERAEAELSRRTSVRGGAEQELANRRPKGRNRFALLEPGQVPPDADTAAHWAETRAAEFLALSAEGRQRAAEAAEQREGASAEGNRAQLLRSVALGLPAPGAADEVDGWTGSAEAAREAAREAHARLDCAGRELAATERAYERSVDGVRAVAIAPAHRGMGGVRVALAEEPAESLAGRAELLATELEGMRESVEAELADVARHREGIVLRLTTLTETYLGSLARLARWSTLPEGLGEWSKQPFLSIQFASPDPQALPGRLAAVVDAAAADPKKRGGLDLLLAALRAGVSPVAGEASAAFRVRLLRPNRAMQLQWAGVPELTAEFSGGMKLTAAICTYCALAALRSASRSTGRLLSSGPGPLFLDNPLGKASADYLTDLQRALADQLGVQLVYTTGVWDTEALAGYDRVVRLRNLADLRRNVQRLQVESLGGRELLPPNSTGVDGVAMTLRRP